VPIELDTSHEDMLWRLVEELYPRTANTFRDGTALRAQDRGANFYELIWYHTGLDFEIRWRVTDSGDVGYATQTRYRSASLDGWSVVDVARACILLSKLTLGWWKSIGYFGEGRLSAQLNVPGIGVLLEPEHRYSITGFDPTFTTRSGFAPRTPRDIRSDAIRYSASPRNSATGETRFTYSSDERNIARLTTSLVNQLLRSLGHSVVWDLFEPCVKDLM
jgi:hypothetical protein